jgi:polyhydroxybutyrate depolymerase
MNKFNTIFIILNLLTIHLINAQNENYKNEIDSIKIDNIFRSYEAYIPNDIVKQPKLVFVLHGSTMTTKQMLNVTGSQFNSEQNPSKNRIVVYPQGFENYWNDCRKSATYKANLLNLSEVDFLKV